MDTKKWDITQIVDQKDRVAVVSGSNCGIGYETAKVLANKNATVIMAIRNKNKGSEAVNKIKSQNPQADIEMMILDLANLKSIKAFAEEFKKKYARLDLLINNAGVMMPPYSKTHDGFELQFGTNHLGHFSLTMQLLELLFKTEHSRIVTVSSIRHRSGNINFEDLNWEQRSYKALQSYGDSKIANLYFTFELSRKLKKFDDNPIAVAAHQGWTDTELQRHINLKKYLNIFAQKISMGALPILYAAVGQDVKSGNYYGPDGFAEIRGYPKKVESNHLSKNREIAQKLWDVSEELTDVKFSLR